MQFEAIFPTKTAIKTSIKRKPQTGKRASEIFTFVLLRGDSVEILLDRDLEKFQSNEARIHVWGNSNMIRTVVDLFKLLFKDI